LVSEAGGRDYEGVSHREITAGEDAGKVVPSEPRLRYDR
jgi:hypothetical protein